MADSAALPSSSVPATAPAHFADTYTPGQLRLVVFLLAFSNFMVVLDLTIANVSVPHIAGNLGISMDQGAWVITSYAIAEAICVPLTGWLVGRFGVVRVFITAMMGFGLFSLLCGLAPTLGMLVACRIGQGLCGAPIMPASQTLLVRLFDTERRAKAMAFWSMTTALGPATGPIIGGFISDNFSWHWIFLINVPLAAACCASAAMLLRRMETPLSFGRFDGVGLVLLVFWIGSLQLMLDIGNDHDWFGDWKIVALALCAGLGFVVFVIWELTEDHPIVDLRIFRHRGFTVAVITLAFCFGAYFAGIVVIPQWLQSTMGYSATMAGLTTAFTAMTAVAVGPLISRMTQRVDLRMMVTFALFWLALWAWVRSHWSTEADFWTLAYPQIVQGISMSMFMIPLTLTALNSVEPRETASAAGMQAFMRTLAMAVSTSLVLTLWSQNQRMVGAGLVDNIDPGAIGRTAEGAGLGAEQAVQLASRLVEVQARTIALDNVFLAAAAIQILAGVMIWAAPRVAIRPQAPVASH